MVIQGECGGWIVFFVLVNDDLGNAANEDRRNSHDDAAKSRDIGSQFSLAGWLAWKHSLEVNLERQVFRKIWQCLQFSCFESQFGIVPVEVFGYGTLEINCVTKSLDSIHAIRGVKYLQLCLFNNYDYGHDYQDQPWLGVFNIPNPYWYDISLISIFCKISLSISIFSRMSLSISI